MEIIVLLKQVPATESFIGIADDGVSIKTEDIKWVINPYDEYAVEEALRIRSAHGGTVTIISAGPERSVEAIRTALAMGFLGRGIEYFLLLRSFDHNIKLTLTAVNEKYAHKIKIIHWY